MPEDRSAFDEFNGIPSFDNTTGKPAMYCGLTLNQRCTDYADQLYWLTRDYRFGSSTLEAPQVGHVTSLRFFWEANSAAEPNQPSKRWPEAQSRSKTII